MAMTPVTAIPARAEMFEKAKRQSLFAQSVHSQHRQIQSPTADSEDGNATDFEDADSDGSSESEFDEQRVEQADVPRQSFETLSKQSFSTISAEEEALTPRSTLQNPYNITIRRADSIQGPSGPHLFRTSFDSLDHTLQLSPMYPRKPSKLDTGAIPSSMNMVLTPMPCSSDEDDVRNWSPRQVAEWMYAAGFDQDIIDKFEEHDIDGSILLDLQFEDLKELGIASFGKRHHVWNELGKVRADGSLSPIHTPFQDISSPCTGNDTKFQYGDRSRNSSRTTRKPSSSRRRMMSDDAVTPAESVSIVAIEQLIPKPHKCSKGENCSKWRKQQQLLQQIVKERPEWPISPAKGGHIFMFGNPAGPDKTGDGVMSPTSEAMPSVVASSDLLGPCEEAPSFALQEESLRHVQSRDPQENVKQFLQFQHVSPSPDLDSNSPILHLSEDSPRYDVFPLETPSLAPPSSQPPPLPSLRQLPRLSIPRSASANTNRGPNHSSAPSMNRTSMSPQTVISQQAPPHIYRHATPASDADVPLTAVNIEPVVRATSHSVPPNMQYRELPKHRPSSKDAHAFYQRPSLLPTVPEAAVSSPQLPTTAKSVSPNLPRADRRRPTHERTASSPVISKFSPYDDESDNPTSAAAVYGSDTTFAGWMKKRRTKVLRHEWNDAHFRLNGTHLAMHASAAPQDTRLLDTIDVDHYAVACSSVAGNSKLAAAMKRMKISSGGKAKGLDDAAFAFQLVPNREEKEKVVKDDSASANSAGSSRGGTNGKTHHFAVKTRDERIDWMREVMLAKAKAQKQDGYDVVINGEAL